jgi:hypothetical protein
MELRQVVLARPRHFFEARQYGHQLQEAFSEDPRSPDKRVLAQQRFHLENHQLRPDRSPRETWLAEISY